jgi:hypothetical protein
LDREFILERLINIASNDSFKEVALACCKFLFVIPINNTGSFALNEDECKRIINRILGKEIPE